MSKFWKRKDLKLNLKRRIFNTTVRSILLYGCETWTTRVSDLSRLEVFERRCLRYIACLPYKQPIKNHALVDLFKNQPSIAETVAKRRWTYVGHVLRMDEHRLPKQSFKSTPEAEWKRPRGGVKTTLQRQMSKEAEQFIIPLGVSRKKYESSWRHHLEDLAKDRNQYKEMVNLVSASNAAPRRR